MTSNTSRSAPRCARDLEALFSNPAPDRSGDAGGCPDSFEPGATHRGLNSDDCPRLVLTWRSWQPRAALDQSYPGDGLSWSDDRARTAWHGSPSPWYGPHVAALERELAATRRELGRTLRALGHDARSPGHDATVADRPAPPTRVQGSSRPKGGDERHPIDDARIRLSTRTVVVVAGDDVSDTVLGILRSACIDAVGCSEGEALLRFGRPGFEACLVTGACMMAGGGLDLVDRLRAAGSLVPAVVIIGRGDVSTAVRAMRAGVSDVIEEPVGRDALLKCLDGVLSRVDEAARLLCLRGDAARYVAGLTPRQREIMTCVLAGHPSKNIAADLGISRRTVENHRASIMRKTGARSLPALARLALAAEPIP